MEAIRLEQPSPISSLAESKSLNAVSPNARAIIDDVIPPPGDAIDLKLVIFFFGANDACTPGDHQHVDLADYEANIRAFVNHKNLVAHGAKAIIVAPPPYDEHKARESRKRNAATTKKYAEAAAEIAAETKTPLVDLWNIYMSYAGWKVGEPLLGDINVPKSDKLDELLSDGLHFNPKAYQLYLDALIQLLKDKLPEIYDADRIFPNYDTAPRYAE
ncbi:hypothetical protein ABW19_dt0200406 [Dactylella cylindrospora]|nr:hypothetical protein ABW19_dt0200406 [Dactylella cylindrospora]